MADGWIWTTDLWCRKRPLCHNQCDQMDRLFNFWPFRAMKICHIAYNINQSNLQFFHSLNESLSKWPKFLNIVPKWWNSPNLVTLAHNPMGKGFTDLVPEIFFDASLAVDFNLLFRLLLLRSTQINYENFAGPRTGHFSHFARTGLNVLRDLGTIL